MRKPLPDFLLNTWGIDLPVDQLGIVKDRKYWFWSTIGGAVKNKMDRGIEATLFGLHQKRKQKYI